jgi:hypothetical protein
MVTVGRRASVRAEAASVFIPVPVPVPVPVVTVVRGVGASNGSSALYVESSEALEELAGFLEVGQLMRLEAVVSATTTATATIAHDLVLTVPVAAAQVSSPIYQRPITIMSVRRATALGRGALPVIGSRGRVLER